MIDALERKAPQITVRLRRLDESQAKELSIGWRQVSLPSVNIPQLTHLSIPETPPSDVELDDAR